MIIKRLFLITLAFLLVFGVVNVVSAANSTVNSTMKSTSTTHAEHIVVWQDDRDGAGTSHLYYKNMETGVSSRVSWVNSDQTNPKIALDTVVWQDNRDGAGTSHLYYKNLSSGIGSRVSWTNSKQWNAAIAGSTVVWQDDRDGAGTSHLYYKNLVTNQGSRVSWVNSKQYNAAISGRTVVWEDYRDGDTGEWYSPDSMITHYWDRPHLYYKNLDTKLGSRVSWVNSGQWVPSISGNFVVWVDDRDAEYYSGDLPDRINYHAFYKNLQTGAGGRITWGESSPYIGSAQCDPVISGNIAVWYDTRDGWVEDSTGPEDYNYHVYYKNLDTKQGSRISWVNSVQIYPSISGNSVVWMDNRYGKWYIFQKNISTGIGSRVSLVDSNQSNPVIGTIWV